MTQMVNYDMNIGQDTIELLLHTHLGKLRCR